MTRPAPHTPERVTCWHVHLPKAVGAQDYKILDAAEKARADALPDPVRRVQYIAAHAALRRILGAAIGARPEQLSIQSERHGRPVLAHQGAPHFSLSHSGKAAMIALCPTARLGVDLEQRRPRPKARRLVERLFAPAERDLLLPLPAAAFDAGFSRLWVLKEAYIKADGRGLACPLAGFAIDPFALRLLCSAPGFPSGVQLSYKEVCNNFDSALVVCSTQPVEIEHRVLDMRVNMERAA